MNRIERERFDGAIDRMMFKIAEAAELIVDDISGSLSAPAQNHSAPANKIPPDVARRRVANMLRASRFCARPACRRSHCCRGEPLHCLRAVMPLLPAEALEGVLKKRRPGTAKPVPRMRRGRNASEVVRR